MQKSILLYLDIILNLVSLAKSIYEYGIKIWKKKSNGEYWVLSYYGKNWCYNHLMVLIIFFSFFIKMDNRLKQGIADYNDVKK